MAATYFSAHPAIPPAKRNRWTKGNTKPEFWGALGAALAADNGEPRIRTRVDGNRLMRANRDYPSRLTPDRAPSMSFQLAVKPAFW